MQKSNKRNNRHIYTQDVWNNAVKTVQVEGNRVEDEINPSVCKNKIDLATFLAEVSRGTGLEIKAKNPDYGLLRSNYLIKTENGKWKEVSYSKLRSIYRTKTGSKAPNMNKYSHKAKLDWWKNFAESFGFAFGGLETLDVSMDKTRMITKDVYGNIRKISYSNAIGFKNGTIKTLWMKEVAEMNKSKDAWTSGVHNSAYKSVYDKFKNKVKQFLFRK